MANSIANLAVIISGHTKPLEDAMKKAQSKVGSFGSSIGSSIKHGVGASLGAMGLDKMEAAMKAAIADMPGLSEAAERAEKSFGKILLNVTGVGYLLPKVAGILSDVADWMDGITPEMKKQQEIQANMLKAERALADVRIEGLEAVLKTYEAQMDSIDGTREQLRIAEQLRPENDPYLSKNISLAQMAKPNYDPLAPDKARAMKTEIDEHNRVMEAMDEEIAKIEEEQAAYAEWLKMYEDTIKELDKYEEAFGPATREQAALEKRNDLIAEARKLMEDQIPVIDKLKAKFEEAQTIGLTGEELESFKKAYDEAKAAQDKAKATSSSKLSGAATAGSEAAYSIIANAQADKNLTEAKTQTVELKKQTSALQKIEEKTPKPGDFAFGVYRMELK